MNTATKAVEFSFSNNMYKQIDDVVMGSPLSVALTNIFVGYHESKLFESTIKPFFYRLLLPSFCKREHLKMLPFVKIDIFVESWWFRSGKNF